MIEHCPDLASCEEILKAASAGVSLLGEITFTDEDAAHLTSLVREKLAVGVSPGTRYLTRLAPTSFACFLTWTGVTGYQDGAFWPAVEAAIGRLDINWQSSWGRKYLAFLRERGLPTFELAGAHVYVTPILTHGGIPDSCIPEYFARVVRPLVRRELMDPLDSEEIRFVLNEWRTIHAERYDLQAQVENLRRLQERARTSKGNISTGVSEPEQDLRSFFEDRKARLADLDERRRLLTAQRRAFSEANQAVLMAAGTIDELILRAPHIEEGRQQISQLESQGNETLNRIHALWTQLATEPWRAEYTQAVRHLPMDALSLEFDRLVVPAIEDGQDRSAVAELEQPIRERTWVRLLPIGLTLIGIALLTGALLGGAPWPWLAIGGLLFLGGSAGTWRAWRRRSQGETPTTGPHPDVSSAMSPGEAQTGRILALATGLPLSPDKLASLASGAYFMLVDLAPLCAEIDDLHGQLDPLKLANSQYEEALRETAEALGVSTREDRDVLADLAGLLRLSLEQQAAAEEARRILVEEIAPAEEAIRQELAIAQAKPGEPVPSVEGNQALLFPTDPVAQAPRALFDQEQAPQKSPTLD